jgi:hypothetical protein
MLFGLGVLVKAWQYFYLVVFTAGTLVYLILLALLAGLRRVKLLEGLLFLSAIALFSYFAGSLLWLNLHLQRVQEPGIAGSFAWGLGLFGGEFLAPLTVHSHAEYLRRLEGGRRRWHVYVVSIVLYLAALPPLVQFISLGTRPGWSRSVVDSELYSPRSWLSAAMVLCAGLQLFGSKYVRDRELRRLNLTLAITFTSIAALQFLELTAGFNLALLLPGSALGYYALRNRFLPVGVQRNLVFTVSAAFLALLYLTLARRLGTWLEAYLPAVATESILIFLLVIFFEPLQRRVAVRWSGHFEEKRRSSSGWLPKFSTRRGAVTSGNSLNSASGASGKRSPPLACALCSTSGRRGPRFPATRRATRCAAERRKSARSKPVISAGRFPGKPAPRWNLWPSNSPPRWISAGCSMKSCGSSGTWLSASVWPCSARWPPASRTTWAIRWAQ